MDKIPKSPDELWTPRSTGNLDEDLLAVAKAMKREQDREKFLADRGVEKTILREIE